MNPPAPVTNTRVAGFMSRGLLAMRMGMNVVINRGVDECGPVASIRNNRPVNIEQHFVVSLGSVFLLITMARSGPHRVHLCRMSPGPIRFRSQFVEALRGEKQARMTLDNQLRNSANSRSDRRDATCRSFQ